MINEPIPFLANIALIARADGKVSASELGRIESIRTDMKFKKGDLNAALRLVEQAQHKLTPVGSFADQVRNLECILLVAYADGNLGEVETGLIAEFCKLIGVHPDQLERLSREVLSNLEAKGKMCPTCAADAAPDAKFCPKCGASLDAPQESVPVEFDIPASGLAIEFADSTGTSFPKALQLAKQHPSYKTCVRSKKSWHLVSFPSVDVEAALPLAEALSGLRNRRLHVDGREKEWDEIFGFAWCAQRRDTAYRPIEYCFGKDGNRLNPWGCIQTQMEWTEWADWFSYGRWVKKGLISKTIVWQFDKAKIRHELESNLFRYRFCPYLKTAFVEAALRNFPDEVSPEGNADWQYSRQHEQVPGSIEVTETEGSGSFAYTNKFYADGVRPKGLRVLAVILTKAVDEVKRAEVNVKTLLG